MISKYAEDILIAAKALQSLSEGLLDFAMSIDKEFHNQRKERDSINDELSRNLIKTANAEKERAEKGLAKAFQRIHQYEKDTTALIDQIKQMEVERLELLRKAKVVDLRAYEKRKQAQAKKPQTKQQVKRKKP